MSATRHDALFDATKALSRVSAELEKAGDDRRYGVNVAYWVVSALLDGKSVAEAVQQVSPVPRPPS